MDDLEKLTDEQLHTIQDELSAESNRRARIAYFPGQLEGVILDARRERHTSNSRIREIFEDAMNANID